MAIWSVSKRVRASGWVELTVSRTDDLGTRRWHGAAPSEAIALRAAKRMVRAARKAGF